MYIQGQRWFSEAEPELGLGILDSVQNKTISVVFPASDELRTYGLKTAPLKRIKFEIGDSIETEDGNSYEVLNVQDNNGVLFYLVEDGVIPEMLIKSALNFTRPQDKLFAGNFDSNQLFNLRYQSYLHLRNYQLFPNKGLLGSRVKLLPHQSYLCHIISQRITPRVMLADEVGLGKTIEAALILTSQIQMNKVHRSLIIVPDSLVYQWYFEILYKFNLQFKVMSLNDELELEALTIDEGQHYIISMQKIMTDKSLMHQLQNEHWDLLIVDEAHQLKWFPNEPSAEYLFIKELSEIIKSVILLSATPEIMGKEGHFSRLQLLDQNKFSSFTNYVHSTENYQNIIPIIKKICDDTVTNAELLKIFNPEELKNLKDKKMILQSLVDRHGTGRIYFRNTREHLEKNHLFFPKRKLSDYPIKINGVVNDATVFKSKIKILLDLLQNSANQKILLLVHSKNLVKKISQFIKKETNIPFALFHSEQSLMERDRQAAYFSDEEGAKILLCTEIGSEGRNFEFAHHLFLFDIPKNAEQLEQRIGRLDRIGQTKDINIHVPYIQDSFEEVLFLWYKDVLKSFEKAPKAASSFYSKNYNELHQLIESPFNNQAVKDFIFIKSSEYQQICKKLEGGRDLLLDLNSFNSDISNEVIESVNKFNPNILSYIEQICDAIGIHLEDLNHYSYYIKPSDNMYLPSFPALPIGGYSFTSDRQIALVRDDLQFMSWEHPFIQGAFDVFINSEIGNMAFVSHNQKLGDSSYFEFIFKLETIKGSKSNSSKFLPLTPLRVLLDSNGVDCTQKFPKSKIDPYLTDARSSEQKDLIGQLPKESFKNLLLLAKNTANKKAQRYIHKANEEAKNYCDNEVFRLKDLQKINQLISSTDLDQWLQYSKLLKEEISNSTLSVDSIRVII